MFAIIESFIFGFTVGSGLTCLIMRKGICEQGGNKNAE